VGVNRRPVEIQFTLRPGSPDWAVLESAEIGEDGPLSRIVADVSEYALGFRYLFLRTRTGRTYSFSRDDVLKLQRRRSPGGSWLDVPNRRIGDRPRPGSN